MFRLVEIGSETIATFKVNTTTKIGYDWTQHLYAFLSASPDYNTQESSGFVLTKVGSPSITVPYTLTVTNTTGGNLSTDTQTFTGENYFTDKASAAAFCIDMSRYKKTSEDTFGDTYGAINYEGQVDITINDFAIPGSGNSFIDVMKNSTLSQSYIFDYARYIGKYESNIYYHIVYAD